MRALVLTDHLEFNLDHPKPECKPGEVLIKVVLSGICNTDIELTKGYMSFKGIPGHEFTGIIESRQEAILEKSGFAVGDRVVAEINCVAPNSQSRDYYARAMDPERTTLGIDRHDGVFAEYVTAPIANLHHIPNNISDWEGVFVEPLAAACQILEQVHISPTNHVAVIGDGKLGLLCAQVIATTECDLTIFGKHSSKLALVKQPGIKTQLSDEWNGNRDFDTVIECSGEPSGFDQACHILRPRGTLVLKSTFDGFTRANLTALVIDEITLVGSRCGPFATAIHLLETKRVNVLPLITAEYSLDHALAAFQHASQKGTLKILIRA